jgi:hypothetical protein
VHSWEFRRGNKFANVDALLSSSEKCSEARTASCNLGRLILCYQNCCSAFWADSRQWFVVLCSVLILDSGRYRKS